MSLVMWETFLPPIKPSDWSGPPALAQGARLLRSVQVQVQIRYFSVKGLASQTLWKSFVVTLILTSTHTHIGAAKFPP